MKRMILFVLLATFVLAVSGIAADESQKSLTPVQKIMQGRAALLKGMNKDLAEGKFEAVSKSAGALASETKATAGKLPNPLAKEITQALSVLAAEAADAAAKNDAAGVKAKLTGVKGKCDECHAKIRDKK